ncbi:hypothetical protein HY374_03480 [Candidatus Berkelbacteria bacterium]|nr:hypothetical protein [Candidatus Berkelbacteria bacterium]
MNVGPPPHETQDDRPASPAGGRQTSGPVTAAVAVADEPKTAEQAERLEVVRELIAELKRLCGFVTDADDRLTRIQAELHEDTPPGARAVWERAAGELRSALGSSIQLATGDVPTSLDEAAKTFRHWSEVFAENAVGPGGEGLHDDPERLTAFQEKLEAVDPPVTVLVHRLRDLLARHDLDVDTLAKKAAQTAASAAKDEDRLHTLDPLIAELKGSWARQLDETTTQAASLALQLTRLSQTAHSQAQKTDAEEGLSALNMLPLDHARQTLGAIIEWAEKWHDDSTFSATTLAARIQSELAQPMREVREELGRLSHEFAAATLAAREATRVEAEVAATREASEGLLTRLRARYQALVALRRQKLGTEPDERYFGAVAKDVNDVITRLASLETQLTDSSQFSISNYQSSSNASMTKRVEEALQETEQFVDPATLEALLGAQAERAQQAALATAKRQASEAEVVRQAREATEAEEAAEAARRGYTGRVAALGTTMHQLHEAFRSALTYATELEPFVPDTAEEQYAALDRIAPAFAQTNRLDTIINLARPAAEIEHDLTELETTFGTHGAVKSTLDQLTRYQHTHPINELQRRHGLVEVVRNELQVRREELNERRREVADASAERRALTPDEARRWIELLDTQRDLLAKSTHAVEEVGTRLDALARHLDDTETGRNLESLRQQLEELAVPTIARRGKPPREITTPAAHNGSRSALGERLRAQLAEPPDNSPQTSDNREEDEEEVAVNTEQADEEVDIPIRHE